jgi:hypothetical protein
MHEPHLIESYWRSQNNCSSSDRFITVQCRIFALSVLFCNVYYKQQPATLKNKPFQTVARCAIILHTPVLYHNCASEDSSMHNYMHAYIHLYKSNHACICIVDCILPKATISHLCLCNKFTNFCPACSGFFPVMYITSVSSTCICASYM